MNSFYLITISVLLAYSFLCFYLPYKCKQKTLGLRVGITLVVLTLFGLIINIDFLIIFLWLSILVFQIIFISYWTLQYFNMPMLGKITAVLICLGVLFILLSPWVSDWTITKTEVEEVLSRQNIMLMDNFDILNNEVVGVTDYAHSIELKISKSDYNRIANKIRSSKNFKGLITDLSQQLPMANHSQYDTVNFETNNHIEREYYTEHKMKDGTYHFMIQLSKKDSTLSYLGIKE